jgi:thioredoxin-like negative regulator of GroEL
VKKTISLAAFVGAICCVFSINVVAVDNSHRYGADAILNGDYHAAEQKLRAHLNESPTDAFAMLNLAAIYDRSGRSDEARDLYQRIMELRNNPYAKLANRRVEPVKSIARTALDGMDRRP